MVKVARNCSTGQAAGLRVAEVCHLRVADIDGERMALRVEQGKGARDRYDRRKSPWDSIQRCPVCREGRLRWLETLPRSRGPPDHV